MNVFPILPAQAQAFLPFLPAFEWTEHCRVFGAVLDETPCGAAILEGMGHSVSLRWLFVEPSFRCQGVGSALLKTACDAAFSAQDVARMTMCWPIDSEWSPVFSWMLSKTGWLVKVRPVVSFSLQREALAQCDWLSQQAYVHCEESVIPLEELSALQLRELRMKYEEKAEYLLSRAPLDSADKHLSHVMAAEHGVDGLTLVHREDDAVVLDLLSIDSANLMGGLALLRKTAHAALKTDAATITFDCVTPQATRLARHLLGIPGTTEPLYEAELSRHLHRKD